MVHSLAGERCWKPFSNVGSAFAILALQACGELPGGTLGQANQAIGQTERYWYRLAPGFPYVDSQREHRAFGFGRNRVLLSEDNCQTWAHHAEFVDAEYVTFSCLLKNGNVLFATREKLFLSQDDLKTLQEITVKNSDSSDYVPHTPESLDRPGWYFYSLDGVHTWDVDGEEMLVWGNYCNVDGGPVPVNFYYSTDSGRTVKIAYSFGQNPTFQELDADPKRLLGDRGNPVICRHIHAVVYNPDERAFYARTGDLDRGHGHDAIGDEESMMPTRISGLGKYWCQSTRTHAISQVA